MLAVMHEEFDSMEIDSMLNNLENMKKNKTLISSFFFGKIRNFKLTNINIICLTRRDPGG